MLIVKGGTPAVSCSFPMAPSQGLAMEVSLAVNPKFNRAGGGILKINTLHVLFSSSVE